MGYNINNVIGKHSLREFNTFGTYLFFRKLKIFDEGGKAHSSAVVNASGLPKKMGYGGQPVGEEVSNR